MAEVVPTVPLGSLVEIQRGSTYKSALLGQDGPVLLGLSTIARNGGFRSDSLRTYGGDSPERMLVRPGGIYASLKDVTQSADLLGSVARLPLHFQSGRLTQDTVRLDLVSDLIDPDFLYWQLLTPQYRNYCRAHSTGTTNLGLPRDDFLAYPMWLPPLDVQRRIAGVLGNLDHLIDTNRRLAQLMDDLLIESWRLAADEVAEGRAIGELVTISKGISYKGRFLASAGRPMLNLANFARDGVFIERGTKYYTDTIKPDKILQHGDLIVANTDLTQAREILAWPILNPYSNAVSTHHTFRLRPIADASCRLWIYGALRQTSVQRELVASATGTTVAALPKDVLEQLVVPWPPTGMAQRWLEAASVIVQQTEQLRAESATLNATRDELLPLLMSGRVVPGEVA